jgi:SWI/SNF-related matrix-associated actin-dependent regulator of chromatin subfamily A member 5
MDRAHRIGQKKVVRVFRFVTEGTVEEKIIERADRKLFLDAAVIQQGRLAEQNTNLNKSELMSMVKFGADEIFKGKGSQLTDKDIDTILADGEARTAEQQVIMHRNGGGEGVVRCFVFSTKNGPPRRDQFFEW